MNHQEEAVNIVMKYDKTQTLKKALQLRQMGVISQLIKYGSRPLGYHDPEQVGFVVDRLIQYKVIVPPVILHEVYTNDVWEQAHVGMEK